MINTDQKRNLLELKQRFEDAKAALSEAVEATANDLEIDKGVLNKCVTAWFKGDPWKLRAGAQLTLDLLEEDSVSVSPSILRTAAQHRAAVDDNTTVTLPPRTVGTGKGAH